MPYVFRPPLTAADAARALVERNDPEAKRLRECSVQQINRIKSYVDVVW